MKKKFGAVLMAGVMACALTASIALTTGCNGSKIYDFEITFANTTGQNLASVVDAAIERFNVLYPNIKVTWIILRKTGMISAIKSLLKLAAANSPTLRSAIPTTLRFTTRLTQFYLLTITSSPATDLKI